MSENAQSSPLGAENNLIKKMMEQDSFSPEQAVEEIVSLTRAAAALGEDALDDHSSGVIGPIYSFSMEKSPDEQSRLVNFTALLQKRTVLDPKTGEPVMLDMLAFWTDLPGISRVIAEHRISASFTLEESRNFTAFLAQLCEVRLSCFAGTGTNVLIYEDLVWRFLARPELDEEAVQIACMWVIYAPSVVWANVQSRVQTRHGRFEQASWTHLKKVLRGAQGTYLNEYSQEALRHALLIMEQIENKAATNRESETRGGEAPRVT